MIDLKGLTKEQILALWQAENEGIKDTHSWLEYLDNLNDKTGFNTVVVDNLLRLELKLINNGTYKDFPDVDAHFDDFRKLVKENCMYLPDLKTCFGNKAKKEIENIDFSIYKFE